MKMKTIIPTKRGLFFRFSSSPSCHVSSGSFLSSSPASCRITHPEETRHVSCAFSSILVIPSTSDGSAETNGSALSLPLLFRSKTSRIPLRRKVDLSGLVRGLMGPLGAYHYFTRCRPFQVGVKQSMKLFMALSNGALLIHQGFLCENGVDEIF